MTDNAALKDFTAGGCSHLTMRKAPFGLSIDACPKCGRLAFGKQKKWEWSGGFVTVPFDDVALMNAAMACAFMPSRKVPYPKRRKVQP